MTMFRRYLVIDSNAEGRITHRSPTRLRNNEVAFRLNVHIPDGWARVASQEITLELPPPPAVSDLEIKA